MGFNNGYESGYGDGFADGVLKSKRNGGTPPSAGFKEIILDNSNFRVEEQDGSLGGFIELDLSELSVGGCVFVRDNVETPSAGFYGGANLRVPPGITKIYENGYFSSHNGSGEVALGNIFGFSYVGGTNSNGRFCMMICRTIDTLYAVYSGPTE